MSLEHPSPTDLEAYVVDANTLSVTWDLPGDLHNIDKVYITVTELGETNRTIQTQSFDKTIKKFVAKYARLERV